MSSMTGTAQLALAVGVEERRDQSVTRLTRKCRSALVNMVRPVGVEPTTCGLRVRCSAGLS